MRSEPWTKPPLFIDIVSLADIERALRGPQASERWLSPNDAALLGRVLRSDYVVIAHIDSVRHDNVDARSTRHAAKTTRGVDTAYAVEEGHTRSTVYGNAMVVDVRGQQRAESEPFTATATGSYSRSRFVGDYHNLELSKAEEQGFDRPQGSATDRDLMRSLAGETSRRLAATVFDEILRRIP
jgi:hypothetical protein